MKNKVTVAKPGYLREENVFKWTLRGKEGKAYVQVYCTEA